MSEIGNALLALLGLLILIPVLVWVIFNRFYVWTRLLEVQVGKLAGEVEKLPSQGQCPAEKIGELKKYIETVNQIVKSRRRYARFLTIKEASDLSTLTSITREMLRAIRESAEPGANLSPYLEKRRKTISLLFDRMVGT